MTNTQLIRRLSILLMLLLLLTACQTSVSQRYATASNSYSSIVESMTTFGEMGIVDTETLLEFDKYRRLTNQQLNEVEVAIIQDRPLDARFLLDSITARLDQMLKLSLEAKHNK